MIELARTGAVRYSPQEVGEAVDFLEWLLQLNFVLLGYREYELRRQPRAAGAIRTVPASGLGILSDVQRSTFADPTPLAELDPDVRSRIEDGDLLVFSKTNAYSTVHRRARMDYIGVRKVDQTARSSGEARLIGLFTSKAYMEPAAKTPLLHHKLEQILAAEDLIPGSHDYKEVDRALRVVPEGRAVPGLHRGAPPARGRAAPAREARRHPGARAPRPVRAQRLGRGRPAARPVQRGAPQAPAAVLPRSSSTDRPSTTTCRWARRSRPASSSPCTSIRAPRSPRSRTSSSSERSSGSRAAGTTICSTP